jgi:hypothetical protein
LSGPPFADINDVTTVYWVPLTGPPYDTCLTPRAISNTPTDPSARMTAIAAAAAGIAFTAGRPP